MDLGLRGKVALVAGASRGIGLAVAEALLGEGMQVTITGRRRDALESARERLEGRHGTGRVEAVVADLGSPEGVGAALVATVGRWGGLDAAVANIGSGSGTRDWRQGPASWHRSFDENFWPAVLLCEAAIEEIGRRGGSVVLIGSIAGRQRLPAPVPYGAAKAALCAYTAYLASRVADLGVRVNCVCPGNVLVDGGTWDKRRQGDPNGLAAYLEAEVPLGRLGRPEEIADVVAFLCSNRAGFMTGASVTVDGGQSGEL